MILSQRLMALCAVAAALALAANCVTKLRRFIPDSCRPAQSVRVLLGHAPGDIVRARFARHIRTHPLLTHHTPSMAPARSTSRTALIAGATGATAKRLTEELLAQGFAVIGVSRRAPTAFTHAHYSHICADLLDPLNASQALAAAHAAKLLLRSGRPAAHAPARQSLVVVSQPPALHLRLRARAATQHGQRHRRLGRDVRRARPALRLSRHACLIQRLDGSHRCHPARPRHGLDGDRCAR